jgi:hypothetical protein
MVMKGKGKSPEQDFHSPLFPLQHPPTVLSCFAEMLPVFTDMTMYLYFPT